MKRRSILVCDDDPLVWSTMKMALSDTFDLVYADSAEETLVKLAVKAPDLIILDLRLRTEEDGLELLPVLKRRFPQTPVVISSGLTDFDTVLKSFRLGAVDYIPKHSGVKELRAQIERAIAGSEAADLAQPTGASRAPSRQNIEPILVGNSHSIEDLRRLIARARAATFNVFLVGEPGTGKEVVARLLRRSSTDGASEPFIPVDASAIPATLAESFLFGHEKGSFTGADRMKKGVFEEAHGGTLFLDEITNMSYELQAKLLRVLQEREVLRVGAAKAIPVDVRIIAATNRDPEEMCEKGVFRYDLYSRLAVLTFRIPPLRERIEDIPLLLEHFGKRFAVGGQKITFTEAAVAQLMKYRWPGNVRELGNLVASLSVLHSDPKIDFADLPLKVRALDPNLAPPVEDVLAQDAEMPFYERLKTYERHTLQTEFAKHGGNISQMARTLRMDRSHLHQKLKEHDIHR